MTKFRLCLDAKMLSVQGICRQVMPDVSNLGDFYSITCLKFGGPEVFNFMRQDNEACIMPFTSAKDKGEGKLKGGQG